MCNGNPPSPSQKKGLLTGWKVGKRKQSSLFQSQAVILDSDWVEKRMEIKMIVYDPQGYCYLSLLFNSESVLVSGRSMY